MEDRINKVLHKYFIEQEFWHRGKLNGVNIQRLMANCNKIIPKFKDIFSSMNREEVSNEDFLINMKKFWKR